MAKDPAFLFYSTDFFMGTIDMTDEQVGQYIRLMCLQHQKGHLTEAIMLSIMKGKLDDLILSKFVQDSEGLYYNKRLELEIEKRRRFTDSRARNLKGASDAHTDKHVDSHMDSHKTTHMDTHMETHMVNVNENENRNENKQKGSASKKEKEPRHKHGQYGWVLLTATQYDKLLADLGEAELERCIAYVDESAQATDNKNKWKDWNLVIRKCSRDGWGKNRYPNNKQGRESNGTKNTGFRPSTGFRQP
jgi:uncharacterized protein YdaU (DUF1376 family)